MEFKFAIIIATCNRCESLKDTLDSLLKQEVNWDDVLEIIIVDNNSTDNTQKVVGSYTGQFQTKLLYLKEEKQGKSYALNYAIAQTKADLLIFTDDDVVLSPQWLAEIIGFFKKNDADVLGGRTLPLYSEQTPEWVKNNQHELRGAIVSYDYGDKIIDYKSGQISAFIGANVVYKKKIFEEVGLYNTKLGPGQGTFGDDIEMFNRAAARAKKIFYSGRVLAWHKIDPKRTNLFYIAKWNFQHGKSVAVFEMMNNKKKLTYIGRIPRYLFRGLILKAAKLVLSVFRPNVFLKCWSNLFFNLGMMFGYQRFK